MRLYKLAQSYFIRGENAENLTKATGEAGDGYYFSPATNRGMVDYYTQEAKHVWTAKPKASCKIIDLTTPEHVAGIMRVIDQNSERLKQTMQFYVKPKVTTKSYQRNPYAVQEYVQSLRGSLQEPDAYLIKHYASGIPSGKQLVILNLDAFELEQIK